MQLQMDDASKLYIANAGPLIGGGFEVRFWFFSNSNFGWVLDMIKSKMEFFYTATQRKFGQDPVVVIE